MVPVQQQVHLGEFDFVVRGHWVVVEADHLLLVHPDESSPARPEQHDGRRILLLCGGYIIHEPEVAVLDVSVGGGEFERYVGYSCGGHRVRQALFVGHLLPCWLLQSALPDCYLSTFDPFHAMNVAAWLGSRENDAMEGAPNSPCPTRRSPDCYSGCTGVSRKGKHMHAKGK